MFDHLGDKLDAALRRLRGRAVLNERMIDGGLKELRRALLEADVNFKVVKDFLARVRERALGGELLGTVKPGQQIVKIVHDELASLLGSGEAALARAKRGPTVILLVGLQGSGKTTSAAKLAHHLIVREANSKRQARGSKGPGGGRARAGAGGEDGAVRVPVPSVLLAGCDLQRPAAIEQLETLAGRVGAAFVSGQPGGDPVAAATAAREVAKGHDTLIVDAAGRLQVDDRLMGELEAIRDAVLPHETLLVADAMTGQDAVNIASVFSERVGITGVIMTKLDGDARGGAALSVLSTTGRPIKFIGTGEGVSDLERVDPGRLAGRILRQGDVVGLVEKAQQAIDEKEARGFEEKFRKGRRLSLQDMLTAMQQVQRMGPLDQLLKLIPGASRMALPQKAFDAERFKHVEALILSMTPEERQRPEIIDASRRARIARGSGRPVAELNRLLKQHREMSEMMPRMMKMVGGAGVAPGGRGAGMLPIGRGGR